LAASSTRTRSRSKPFTLAHFKAWAADLTLDDGVAWVLEPFQEAFFADVFAGVREAWLIVPEANGKTTATALLCVYHAEHRSRARVSWAAASREQAEIGYDQAAGIVAANERLDAIFECLPGYRRIRCPSNGSRIQIMASDERTGDGLVPTFAVLDELGRQKDLRLYRAWSGKLGKRGGQLVAISTAGEPDGDFESTRELIRRDATDLHREGAFTRAASANIVLHEYAVPAGADVDDMQVVKQANPFSGITVETLRVKRSSPTMSASHWARFTCNLPTRPTSSAILEAEWDAAETSDRIPEGEPIWLGLDVAWRQDATALVPLWWKHDSARLLGAPTILVPPRDGTSLSPDRIKEALLAIHARNPVHTIVLDTFQAMDLADWAEARLDCEAVQFRQSISMHVRGYQSFMAALRERKLWHTGDKALRRHVLNAIERVLPGGDSCFARPSHSRDGDQTLREIDALIAAMMVHYVAAENDGESEVTYIFDTSKRDD
jgi:phage terminase large subunit-like protein